MLEELDLEHEQGVEWREVGLGEIDNDQMRWFGFTLRAWALASVWNMVRCACAKNACVTRYSGKERARGKGAAAWLLQQSRRGIVVAWIRSGVVRMQRSQ